MADDATDPSTTGGRVTKRVSENASEIAGQAVGMGLFVGLLVALTSLLLIREAGLVAFAIPNGLLAFIGLTALLVGSAMDTSVLPE